MANIARFQAVLDGFGGGKGVNTFHFLGADLVVFDQAWVSDTAAILRDVYTAIASALVAGTSVTIEPKVTVHDVATGNLTAVYGASWTGPVTSTNTTGNSKTSRATQACVRLITNGIVGNRVLQGRVFFGPIGQGQLGSDGLIDAGSAAMFENALDGVVDWAGGKLAVWHQPRNGVGGAAHPVVSAKCNAVPGTLRSRKV